MDIFMNYCAHAVVIIFNYINDRLLLLCGFSNRGGRATTHYPIPYHMGGLGVLG